jgi:hypothetical protein
MEEMLSPVHLLLVSLLAELSTPYQRENFQSLLAARLADESKALYRNRWKSAAALSRFLSGRGWLLGPLIVMVRAYLLSQLLQPRGQGRRPDLHVMVDLTSLEKTGKFKRFRHWLHYFHGCFGLHIVVLYLCCGQHRVPWSLAIYRGKGTTSPAQLALNLISQLPPVLHRHYFVQVLADGGFASREFLVGLRSLGLPAIVGCSCSRTLKDGRQLRHLYRRGQQLRLANLPFDVWCSWFWQKQPDGRYRKRFVLSTRPLSVASMNRLGAQRWRIEAFFKTMKQRFAMDRFALRRLKAVLRWLFFCWLAYLLSHWVALAQGISSLPDWRVVALATAELFFFALLVEAHYRELERLLAARAHLPDFDLSFRCLL